MSKLSTDKIIREYFKQKDILVKHQLESYNDYIDNIIPNILSQFFPISIDINNEKLLLEYLEFEELPIVNPGLAPNVSEILYTAGGTKKADFLDASAGIGIVNINPDKMGFCVSFLLFLI